MVTTEWLRKTELLSGLEESQLNIILSHSSVKSFPKGETIFRQGEEASRLYILIEGAVGLTVKTGEKMDYMTSTIDKERVVFGMPSLLEPFLYNVTAMCLKPSNVLMIEADHIRKYMEQDAKMGMEIMRRLASIYFNRLNEMREGVSKFVKTFRSKVP
jgi:CRP-like cAMP-binding protein